MLDDNQNQRRIELIRMRRLNGGLTAEESAELGILQKEATAHRDELMKERLANLEQFAKERGIDLDAIDAEEKAENDRRDKANAERVAGITEEDLNAAMARAEAARQQHRES